LQNFEPATVNIQSS